jgi:trichothecene 3-O-acetyltransferase
MNKVDTMSSRISPQDANSMKISETLSKLNEEIHMKLSPLDHIMLRGITRFILCFPLQSNFSHDEVIKELQNGVTETVKQMPYLSGKVCHGRDAKNMPEVIYRKGDTVELKVRDLSSGIASYRELRDERIPPSKLPEGDLSPLPNMLDPKQKAQPIFAIQANFITGGLLLCVCLHHSVADGIGFGTVMEVLGQNCSQIQDPELTKACENNMEREKLFSTVKPLGIEKKHDYPEYHLDDPSNIAPSDPKNPKIPPCSARLFFFPTSKLAALKALASPSNSNTWISTNDALGALAWQCISRARSGRLNEFSEPQIVIPVNCRPRLHRHLPNKYIGNATVCAMAKLPYESITTACLPDLATHVRHAITDLDEAYVLGLIEHAKNHRGDINYIKPRMQSFLGDDITFVSWTGFSVYNVEFGSLGKPDWFRCPYRVVDGVVKILPRRPGSWPGEEEGGLEVDVELEEEVMEKLLSDPLWRSFAIEVIN